LTETITDDALSHINQLVIDQLGFKNDSGRLDQSAHPFTCGLSPEDVRLTTHNNTNDLIGTLSGTIHECGHGIYEQGLPLHLRDYGLCRAAGCGIHESQSRFYENTIGKSFPFFSWLTPKLNETCNPVSFTAKQLYRAANTVRRSPVRISADESTYNLHIIVRYELEKAIFAGTIKVSDLPEAWNVSYSKTLGFKPDNLAEGVLQDIHWSMGLLGYFPSYTIGNLYAASFKAQMQIDLPNMWQNIEYGDFSAPKEWLYEHIHKHGNSMTQEEILLNAVGERDQVSDLMTHLKERQSICDELV